MQQRLAVYDLLQMKIAELSRESQAMATQTGKFDSPFERYEWWAEIIPTELSGLFTLHVEISWLSRGIRRHIQTQTLVPQT